MPSVQQRSDTVLQIRDLRVRFDAARGGTQAVQGVDLDLPAGGVLGVAGESGSGKTALALSVMGLVPTGTSVTGSISYRGSELVGLGERGMRSFRGQRIAMIFQETMTALNPVMRVGEQLMLAARAHSRAKRAEVRRSVVESLEAVRLGDPERVMRSYPHELSGGMCQRAVIAMGLSCGADVLLADEPTTALDVSVQRDILRLIRRLVDERGLAVLFISHDLAVLGEVCDRLAVMYRGEIVETGRTSELLRRPRHPYTAGLLDCLPRLRGPQVALPELPLTEAGSDVEGCRFRDRCSFAVERCDSHPELLAIPGVEQLQARCWRAGDLELASRA